MEREIGSGSINLLGGRLTKVAKIMKVEEKQGSYGEQVIRNGAIGEKALSAWE